MKVEEIFETPKNISDLDDPSELDLVDNEKNRMLFDEYSSNKYQYKKIVLKLTDFATIYQYKTEFFCLDTSRKKVTYYMRYKVGNDKHLKGNFVWQSMVWVYSPVQSDYMSGIARKIFFDYLLETFSVIVTDSEQTWKGRRFWEISISDALRKGLNVYFFDFATKNMVQLEDAEQLYEFDKKFNIWGNTVSNEKKRMVISRDKLI